MGGRHHSLTGIRRVRMKFLRRTTARAAVVAGMLFGLFHLSPWIVQSAAFLGVVFGLLVIRVGSTVPAMLAHATNNATALTLAFLMSKGSGRTTHPPAVLSVAVAVFAVS